MRSGDINSLIKRRYNSINEEEKWSVSFVIVQRKPRLNSIG